MITREADQQAIASGREISRLVSAQRNNGPNQVSLALRFTI